MLDYTDTLIRNIGIVAFFGNAAEYVPTKSGIYQIVPIPFTYSHLEKDRIAERYLAGLRSDKFDLKSSLQTSILASQHTLSVQISQQEPHPSAAYEGCSEETMIRSALMFPPAYIGQADNLRRRFIDHIQGRNSLVREKLEALNISACLTFFRWDLYPASELSNIEAVLIKAHQPPLNVLLR